ncbi:MAG: PQQ-binding-like beta-propeller repeat protein [Verrucomicrobiota bacterium]
MKNCVVPLLALIATAALQTSSLAATFDWPQWRGPNRDDVSKETGLLKSWPAEGPKQLWVYDNAGLGYSGPAIVNGRLYTLGLRGETEFLIALDANTGKEIWAAQMGPRYPNDWGDGPRGTPTVDGDRIYGLSGQGYLVCVKNDGKVMWTKSMTDLSGKVERWGYTESPLVDGNKVVCTPGGAKGAIAAFDKMTGKLLWQTKEFTDGAQYSSLIAANHNGGRQYIQLTMKSIVGVDANNGRVLWREDWPGETAVIPTPIFSNGHVYVTSGYGVGSKLVKIGPGNRTSEVYFNKVMKNHHGGVILVNGYLYGHSDGAGWVCQKFDTGEEVWSYRGFGKGAVAYADGMLYCLEEGGGTVVLVEASPKGWNEKGRFKLAPQTTQRSKRGKIWTHPVISNGKLYLRDQELLHCYDVKAM